MIKDVVVLPDERLFQVSSPILNHEFGTLELQNLINDLIDTKMYKNGVGIAAVQIGILKRVAVIGFTINNPRYKNIPNQEDFVIINPEITPLTKNLIEMDEGCLSVPTNRGTTSRFEEISYKYYNQFGDLINGTTGGFLARVFQHEVDHMNGIIFHSRVLDKLSIRSI